jgi:hypothetical protein
MGKLYMQPCTCPPARGNCFHQPCGACQLDNLGFLLVAVLLGLVPDVPDFRYIDRDIGASRSCTNRAGGSPGQGRGRCIERGGWSEVGLWRLRRWGEGEGEREEERRSTQQHIPTTSSSPNPARPENRGGSVLTETMSNVESMVNSSSTACTVVLIPLAITTRTPVCEHGCWPSLLY